MGVHPPEMTCGFLIQLVFCKKKKKTMWFIDVEVEQETSAPPPKKNPGPAHGSSLSVDVRRLKRFCLSSPLLLTKEQRESDLYCEEGLVTSTEGSAKKKKEKKNKQNNNNNNKVKQSNKMFYHTTTSLPWNGNSDKYAWCACVQILFPIRTTDPLVPNPHRPTCFSAQGILLLGPSPICTFLLFRSRKPATHPTGL